MTERNSREGRKERNDGKERNGKGVENRPKNCNTCTHLIACENDRTASRLLNSPLTETH